MILNVDLIYAEFLEHFLAVVQDEEAINVSTLASGFLRSEVLSTTIEKLSNNHSYIPLSAVKKAGLVDQHGTILTSQENPRSARVKLYVDKIRTLAVLKQLGVDHEKLTEVQQLVLVTCCQEAINRVITGPFRAFSQNVSQISNPLHQVKIIEVIQHMSIVTLGGIAAQLNFNANDTSLSPETILRIKRRRSQFIEMAESNPGIEIPIEIFVDEIPAVAMSVSFKDRIALFDDLVPSLAIDLQFFKPNELLEHQSKLRLLKLQSAILSMTLDDQWRVKDQLLKPGTKIQLGDQSITLPNSISKIMAIIAETNAQRHKASYLDALKKIRRVAQSYEQDWYTWGRNQLPYICSSPAVKELLNSVLAIDLDNPSLSKEPAELMSVGAPGITDWVKYGLSFFAEEEEHSLEIAEEQPKPQSV